MTSSDHPSYYEYYNLGLPVIFPARRLPSSWASLRLSSNDYLVVLHTHTIMDMKWQRTRRRAVQNLNSVTQTERPPKSRVSCFFLHLIQFFHNSWIKFLQFCFWSWSIRRSGFIKSPKMSGNAVQMSAVLFTFSLSVMNSRIVVSSHRSTCPKIKSFYVSIMNKYNMVCTQNQTYTSYF